MHLTKAHWWTQHSLPCVLLRVPNACVDCGQYLLLLPPWSIGPSALYHLKEQTNVIWVAKTRHGKCEKRNWHIIIESIVNWTCIKHKWTKRENKSLRSLRSLHPIFGRCGCRLHPHGNQIISTRKIYSQTQLLESQKCGEPKLFAAFLDPSSVLFVWDVDGFSFVKAHPVLW